MSEYDSEGNIAVMHYPLPVETITDAFMYLSEEESNMTYTDLAALEDVLETKWKAKFEEAHVDTKSAEYRAWLSFFIYNRFPYGTVHAWAKAVSASPPRFLMPFRHSQFGLHPEYFDKYLEVVEGCGTGWDSNCQIDNEGNIIVNQDTQFVRRVWDIQANRVIPRCWVPQVAIAPVSHAWVSHEELHYVWSPLNYRQWGIPMPQGVTLEVVRQDLLRYGIEYTWLDVLCLRQVIHPGEGVPVGNEAVAENERRRAKEWLTDVPLIGGIYQSAKVLTYFNGLGRPYQANADLTNHRHWLKRAWTLQETPARGTMALGGWKEADGVAHPLALQSQNAIGQALERLAPASSWDRIFEMKNRHASNPLDRIAGLFFLLRHHDTQRIPTYIESESEEHAWTRLLYAISDTKYQEDIAWFLMARFPPANHWFPTWHQVMAWPHAGESEIQAEDTPREDHVPPPPGHMLRIRSGAIYDQECTLNRYELTSKDMRVMGTEGLAGLDETWEYYRLRLRFVWENGARESFELEELKGEIDWKVLRPAYVASQGNSLKLSDVPGAYVLIRVPVGQSMVTNEVKETVQLFLVCREVTKWRPSQGSTNRRYFRRVASLVSVRPFVVDGMDIFMMIDEVQKSSNVASLMRSIPIDDPFGSSEGADLRIMREISGELITESSHIYLE